MSSSIWGLGERDAAGEVAVSLGEMFDAHVLGLAFAYEPVMPGAMMGSVPADFIESQRTEANDMANAASDASKNSPAVPRSRETHGC